VLLNGKNRWKEGWGLGGTWEEGEERFGLSVTNMREAVMGAFKYFSWEGAVKKTDEGESVSYKAVCKKNGLKS